MEVAAQQRRHRAQDSAASMPDDNLAVGKGPALGHGAKPKKGFFHLDLHKLTTPRNEKNSSTPRSARTPRDALKKLKSLLTPRFRKDKKMNAKKNQPQEQGASAAPVTVEQIQLEAGQFFDAQGSQHSQQNSARGTGEPLSPEQQQQQQATDRLEELQMELAATKAQLRQKNNALQSALHQLATHGPGSAGYLPTAADDGSALRRITWDSRATSDASETFLDATPHGFKSSVPGSPCTFYSAAGDRSTVPESPCGTFYSAAGEDRDDSVLDTMHSAHSVLTTATGCGGGWSSARSMNSSVQEAHASEVMGLKADIANLKAQLSAAQQLQHQQQAVTTATAAAAATAEPIVLRLTIKEEKVKVVEQPVVHMAINVVTITEPGVITPAPVAMVDTSDACPTTNDDLLQATRSFGGTTTAPEAMVDAADCGMAATAAMAAPGLPIAVINDAEEQGKQEGEEQEEEEAQRLVMLCMAFDEEASMVAVVLDANVAQQAQQQEEEQQPELVAVHVSADEAAGTVALTLSPLELYYKC